MPFAVHTVDDVGFDVVPGAAGGRAELFFAGELEGIVETDHGFGLHPPMLVGIEDATLAVGFEEHRAVAIEAFLKTGARHRHRHRAGAGQKRLVADDLGRLVEQPASFDVVAEGDAP